MLCTAVIVVYQCVAGVLPFCVQLSYHCVLHIYSVCVVYCTVFCIYCTLLCCTTNLVVLYH